MSDEWQDPRCDYPTGTVWSGPRVCGKGATHVVLGHPWPDLTVIFVCGIHNRPLVNRGGTTLPLSEKT